MLECLLDTFTDISEAIPDLQGYESIFKYRPEVLDVLKRCYGDIIQFYHMAFDVLGRPGAFGIRGGCLLMFESQAAIWLTIWQTGGEFSTLSGKPFTRSSRQSSVVFDGTENYWSK